jgi:Lysylphosphatidylglycerol synthase TM region
VSRSGTQPVGFGLRRVLLSLFCVSLTAGSIALAWPRLAEALDGAGKVALASDTSLLGLAGLLFAAVPASCGLLWRHAIVRAGGRLPPGQACARYGVGSLVNSFAPCHLGDVVRAALLYRALPSPAPRRIAGCVGLVEGVRITTLVALALVSWLPSSLGVLVVVGAAAAAVANRKQAALIGLAALGPATKVAAVAVTLLALGIPDPLTAAFAIVPALELAALFPLTPANIGAASAAVSVVLHTRGIPLAEAVPASIVLHGVETGAGVLFGAGSAIFVLASRFQPALSPKRRSRPVLAWLGAVSSYGRPAAFRGAAGGS